MSSSSSSSSSWFNSNTASSHVIDDKKPLKQLNPNQFYKICPLSDGSSTAPICGDSSEFCFYFTKPTQKSSNNEKLLVEIMGGGACWDAQTCNKQADYLYVNNMLDNALGRSCQEVQYSFSGGNGGRW